MTAHTPGPAAPPKTTPPHLCHADGCDAVVPQDVFFCAAHFSALPARLKERVGGVQPSGVRWADRRGSDWAGPVNDALTWLRLNVP